MSALRHFLSHFSSYQIPIAGTVPILVSSSATMLSYSSHGASSCLYTG